MDVATVNNGKNYQYQEHNHLASSTWLEVNHLIPGLIFSNTSKHGSSFLCYRSKGPWKVFYVQFLNIPENQPKLEPCHQQNNMPNTDF
ncbi:LOW QUALITY PROTEIN: hypothetical protein TorRG33x02_036250 [Trema orientale]|uniref:Uncharacterized protein n=1 Tax=Trema orientale TaxID=63057 RepID=A0A2P5FRZ9_TREOI|nr:LOW QUALITY PROTEIN: hypothetical protein TorRG33x02_036250 [Trema orientale]